MRDPDLKGSHAPTAQRLTVVVDGELLGALRAHQLKVEGETQLRVSLSQTAGGLMRKGLHLCATTTKEAPADL